MLSHWLCLTITTITSPAITYSLANGFQGATTQGENDTEVNTRVFDLNIISNPLKEFCLQVNVPISLCSCSLDHELCTIAPFINNNTINNNNNNNTHRFRRNELTIVYASVTILSSLLGIVGNAFVLLIAYKNRANLPPCKLHIAQLAVVNFIFCVVQVIIIIPLYWTNSWLYNLMMCKVLRGLMEGGSLLTVYFIFIIAIERHLLIMYPMKSNFAESRNIINTLIIMASLVVFITIIPYFSGLDIEEGTGRCVMFEGGRRHMLLPYNAVAVVMYSILPVCVIATLNIKMSAYLSRVPTCELIREEEERTKRLKNNRRIRNSNILILSAFILCTLPSRSILTYFALVDFKVDNMELYMTLAFISYVTYPLQSTLNPILYSMVAKEWRQEIIRMFSFSDKTRLFPENDVDRMGLLGACARCGRRKDNFKKEDSLYNKLDTLRETTL